MKKRVFGLFLASIMILSLAISLNCITVYAVEDDDPRISFDANGGSGYIEPVYMNGNFPLPECTFTPPEGYRFKCWYRKGDPRELQPGDTVYVSSSNTVVSAVWEQIPAKLIFDPGNGTGSMDEVEIFGEYILPECNYIAPEGLEFDAWQIDDQQLQPGESIYVDDILTATALWKELPVEEPTDTSTTPSDTPTVGGTPTNPDQNNSGNDANTNWDVILIIVVAAILIFIACIVIVVLAVLVIKKKKV